MSHTAQWHYAEGGATKGPFSADQMAALVQNGTIAAHTQVWSPTMAAWAPLSQSPLATLLGGGPARPGMPPPGPGAPYGAAPAAMGAAGGTSGNPMIAAVQTCINKYMVFSGRAARPEYWWFVLAIVLCNIALNIVDGIVFGSLLGTSVQLFSLLFGLAVLLPSLAAGVRRLHDTDRSAWWLLIVLVPAVGSVVLLVFLCLRGTPGPNRFG